MLPVPGDASAARTAAAGDAPDFVLDVMLDVTGFVLDVTASAPRAVGASALPRVILPVPGDASVLRAVSARLLSSVPLRSPPAGSAWGFRVYCLVARWLGVQVSGFGFRVSGFGFRVSGFEVRISGFGLWVPGFGFQVSGFGFQSGFRFRGFGFQILSFGFQDSGFGFRVSGFGFGFRVLGFKFRVQHVGCRVQGVECTRARRRKLSWRGAFDRGQSSLRLPSPGGSSLRLPSPGGSSLRFSSPRDVSAQRLLRARGALGLRHSLGALPRHAVRQMTGTCLASCWT